MIMFDQYLVVPGFILVTGTCLLFGQSKSAFDASVLTYYLAFSVARLPLIVLPVLASLLSQPTTWSLHSEAEKRIRNAIAETSAAEDCKHEIFTLSGSLAIDAGIPLSAYTEAGAFWARVADFVPEHYKKDARQAFDPYLIDPMSHVLGNDIAFVLAGYYPRVRFEREFLSRSADLGFAPIETVSFDKKTLTLFFRKACEHNPGLP